MARRRRLIQHGGHDEDGSRLRCLDQRLRDSLRSAAKDGDVVALATNTTVYAAGDCVEDVFLVESGLVKLITLTPSGRECLLAVHGPGDIFGELSLSHPGARPGETAVTMTGSTLRVIRRETLAERLGRDPLLGSLVRWLVTRLSHQQQVITSLATADSQQRLAETLLMLARRLGRPHGQGTRIEPALSHEELSQMVGTTRPRITTFMTRFRALGLVEAGSRNALVVNEGKLAAHLDRRS